MRLEAYMSDLFSLVSPPLPRFSLLALPALAFCPLWSSRRSVEDLLCRPQPQSVFGLSCTSSIWGKLFFHCRQVSASVAREAMKAPTLG